MTEPTLAEQIAAVRRAIETREHQSQVPQFSYGASADAAALRAALATLEASQTSEAESAKLGVWRDYEPCTLGECPVGLFRFGDNCLGFKSEYKTESRAHPGFWQSDAYVVESGEYFVGGAPDAIAREVLIVTPIDALPPPPAEPSGWRTKEGALSYCISELQKLVTNVCYWVEHGQSETAAKAMKAAQDNGWSKIGWRRAWKLYDGRTPRPLPPPPTQPEGDKQ